MSGELVEKDVQPRHSVSSKHDAQVEYERRASNIVAALDGHDVNASGHEDQLQRHFGFWSLCGLALTVDNAWVAFGGSIIVASCMNEFGARSAVESTLLTNCQTMEDLRGCCMSS
jgi:hypothetical protein